MVFTLINAVLFKPVPVPGGARLVSILSRNLNRDEGFTRMSYADFQDYRASDIDGGPEGAIDEEGVISENGNPPQPYHLQRATARNLFDATHQRCSGAAIRGDDEKPSAPPVVVIGYGVWKDRYGSAANVIGRAVRVNGQPASIVGVMPNGYRFPSGVDMWMPLMPSPEVQKRDNRQMMAYGILKRGVSLKEAATEFDGIARRLATQYPVDRISVQAWRRFMSATTAAASESFSC